MGGRQKGKDVPVTVTGLAALFDKNNKYKSNGLETLYANVK